MLSLVVLFSWRDTEGTIRRSRGRFSSTPSLTIKNTGSSAIRPEVGSERVAASPSWKFVSCRSGSYTGKHRAAHDYIYWVSVEFAFKNISTRARRKKWTWILTVTIKLTEAGGGGGGVIVGGRGKQNRSDRVDFFSLKSRYIFISFLKKQTLQKKSE